MATQSPRNPSPIITPRKKTPRFPKTSTTNQKLNFTKSLNDLTPRSKALFFSLCKSPKQKLQNESPNTHQIPNLKSSLPPINKPAVVNTTESTAGNITLKETVQENYENVGPPQEKVTINKLTLKEIAEVIRLDGANPPSTSSPELRPSKNYMKDLSKYASLLQSHINPKSPRTRQALMNLAHDPDLFTHNSFEEVYNNNMGRVGNVRKYMEYLTSKSAVFLNVLDERNRLVRLEKDLNKKFINENIISKNFSDSIFHVNTFQISEQAMESLYYNYYCSPESRKRLNVSQKKFDSKILENRSKFINYQKKLDFVANDLKSKVSDQIKYYKSWETNIKKIEENKEKKLRERKLKASEFIAKATQKNRDFRDKEHDEKLSQQQKTLELSKSLADELLSRQNAEFQRFKEIGLKNKELEQESLSKSTIKGLHLKTEFKEIGMKLEDFDRKIEQKFDRKKAILDEIQQKIKNEEEKSKKRLDRIRTVNDMEDRAFLEGVLQKYRENSLSVDKARAETLKKRALSAKKRELEAANAVKSNRKHLRDTLIFKARDLKDKLDKDDLKSEKSAELRRKKTQILIETNVKRELKAIKIMDFELEKLEDSKRKVLNYHERIEEKNTVKKLESNEIQFDVHSKHIEATNYREKLWATSEH